MKKTHFQESTDFGILQILESHWFSKHFKIVCALGRKKRPWSALVFHFFAKDSRSVPFSACARKTNSRSDLLRCKAFSFDAVLSSFAQAQLNIFVCCSRCRKTEPNLGQSAHICTGPKSCQLLTDNLQYAFSESLNQGVRSCMLLIFALFFIVSVYNFTHAIKWIS